MEQSSGGPAGVAGVDPAYRRLPTVGPHDPKLGSALSGDRARLDAWPASQYLPATVGGPVPVCLRFAPRPLPGDHLSHVRQVDGVEGIVTVLHFLECDPRACWAERFEANAARLAEAGVGSLAVQAAFVPTKHGTNAYTDELF